MKKRDVIVGSAVGVGLLSAATMVFFHRRKTIPEGVEVVTNFDVKRYLGRWYEIARLDFHFEKNMNNTTARYSLNPDGTLKMVNRGYNYKSGKFERAVGKARFVYAPTEAQLKVSFWGPFYGGYNIMAVDADYKYALIAGRSLDHLWILSRETTIPENVKKEYIEIAQDAGYDTDDLIWVKHDLNKK